jgi:hypothetical protein
VFQVCYASRGGAIKMKNNTKKLAAFLLATFSVTGWAQTGTNTATSAVTATGVAQSGQAGAFSNQAALPGYSLGAPSGMVPGWGTVFASMAGTLWDGSELDAALSFGGGFGDPYQSLGGVASLSIGSVDPRDGGSFNRGSLNLGFGHHFRQYALGLGAGVSNIDLWHDSSDDEMDPSYYFTATKLLANDLVPVIWSIGLGNNAYSDVSKDISEDNKQDEWDIFSSIALYVHPQISLIADYTSNMTSVGVSTVPFRKYPLVVNFAAQDVFQEDPLYDETKFLVTVGYGFSFR